MSLSSLVAGGDQLVPQHDPVKRAHVKIWADHCTDRIQKAYYVALMNQDPSSQQVRSFGCPARILQHSFVVDSAAGVRASAL